MTLGRSGSELEVFDILDVISLLAHAPCAHGASAASVVLKLLGEARRLSVNPKWIGSGIDLY
jgi:hypothetical protein